MLGTELYKRGFTRPLLRCLNSAEAKLAVDEVHEGVCGTYIGGRGLAAKILRAGYYWPTLKQDCMAEPANKIILQGLRKKLDDSKGEWAELIPEALWSYNTTEQSSTRKTPFKLVYGSDAMIPIEVSLPNIRTTNTNETDKVEARKAKLDLIEEERNKSALDQLASKRAIARKYNRKLKPRNFTEGDLVLRKVEDVRKPQGHGKLSANWEGSYRIQQVIGKGAYKIQKLNGTTLPNTWNVSSLKMYFS
ncbi:uncharacterized protein [Arachis hypogaea]|uniref:uncharacterized protein n=1 Tax=Arachis hypogaea TaxID=3818 RepID=UPI003B2202CD